MVSRNPTRRNCSKVGVNELTDEPLTQQTVEMLKAHFANALRHDVCTGCGQPIIAGEARMFDIFVKPDSWDAPRFPQELIERLIDMAASGSASPENIEFRHYHNTLDNDCYRLRRQLAPEELQMTSQLNPDQFMFGGHWRFI